MVIYHSINYSSFSEVAFRFLAFLPPAFILIAGFLVGQVYAVHYDLKTWKPYARLLIRGTKLLLIFVALNFGYFVLLAHGLGAGASEFVGQFRDIFLSGNGRVAIFEVLLPIAYFLLLAPALLWFRSQASGAVALCAVSAFLVCFVMDLLNCSVSNLNLMSVGVVGMALGLIPMQAIDRWAVRWAPVLLLYLSYRILSYFFGEPYPLQTLAALVSVLLLYCCASQLDLDGWVAQRVVLLGKYSLLGYLIQIAVLQGIVRIYGHKPSDAVWVFVLCVLTVVVTYSSIRVIDTLRRQTRAVDAFYRMTFA